MAVSISKTNSSRRTPKTRPPGKKTLSSKRKQWLECLCGKDENAIQRQIEGLLWDLRSWWTINSARQFTPCDDNGQPKLFGVMHGLLDRCFATTQLLAVRRLCEPPPSHPRNKLQWQQKRPVWSLVWLLDDMKDNAHLLTRKAIFRAERIRYDHKALERDEERALRTMASRPAGSVGKSSAVAMFLGSSSSQQRHEDMDLLAGVASAERSGTDQVRPELFEALRSRLETTCDDARRKVNKYLAHATPPKNRPRGLTSSPTPRALFRAASVIKETFDLVSNVVFGKGYAFFGVELVDSLEHMDCPLIGTEDVPQVRRVWDETKDRFPTSCRDWRRFLQDLGIAAVKEQATGGP